MNQLYWNAKTLCDCCLENEFKSTQVVWSLKTSCWLVCKPQIPHKRSPHSLSSSFPCQKKGLLFSWVHENVKKHFIYSEALVCFSESVHQLLDENQRYLGQLTSLLQDATQEMEPSVMVRCSRVKELNNSLLFWLNRKHLLKNRSLQKLFVTTTYIVVCVYFTLYCFSS